MADSQPVLFRIPLSGFSDLATVAEHADRLGAIVAALAEAPISSEMSELATYVADKTSLPKLVIRDILDGLATLRGLMARSGISADDVVNGVERSIETQAPARWRDQHQSQWKEAKSAVATAISSLSPESPLFVQQKAKELTYAHQHVFNDVSLITDLRPIYTASADKILATVLTHALSVTYTDADGEKRIEFALDAADVTRLGQIVERAQIKIATAQKLAESSGLRLLVAGDASASE